MLYLLSSRFVFCRHHPINVFLDTWLQARGLSSGYLFDSWLQVKGLYCGYLFDSWLQVESLALICNYLFHSWLQVKGLFSIGIICFMPGYW